MASSKVRHDSLRNWIAELPDVTEAPHRFGAVEFQVHGLEFMHIHGQTHLDIRLSKEDQVRVLREGKAGEHLYEPQGGWVTLRIRSEKDHETAKEVVLLAYNNARQNMAQRKSLNQASAR